MSPSEIDIAPGVTATNVRDIHNDRDESYPIDLCVGEVNGKAVAIIFKPLHNEARIISDVPGSWHIRTRDATKLLVIPRSMLVAWCRDKGVELEAVKE